MANTKVPVEMITGLNKAAVGLGNVDNTADADKPASSAVTTALALKAPLASPTFTGTVAGIDKTMVGLPNVDNTSDANKPVSTATQTALDLKAPIASPTFTGTVGGVSKAMVGLGNVDNTADTAKPVSTAQQTALDGKVTSIVAGSNVTVDDTDPQNPIVSASLVGGAGDVIGPASSVNENFARFDGTGGKTLEDSGVSIASFATAAQGVKADSALQAAAIGVSIQAYDADLTTWAGKTAPSGAVVGDTDAQTLASKTLTAPVINTPTLNNAITVESYAFNTSTNAAVDLANGIYQVATLTGNWVPNTGWPTATAGQFFRLIVKQDGTGSRTITWPSSVKWPSNTAPTITATASKADVFDFSSDGTNWLGVTSGQLYL